MRLITAIFIGKLIAFLTKFLKIGGGSAAPGLYALKIDPNLVEKLSQQIPKNIVITGTNGKTTTSKMLAHFSRTSGLSVIRNHTGSNLERGIASALIANCQLPTVNCQLDLGIWELDEAAFNRVSPKLKPDLMIFLNVSRDQLDRYGETDTVVNKWCETVSKLDPKTTALINSDDPNLAKLKKYFKGKAREFGKKDIKNIKLNGLKGSVFELKIENYKLKINLPIPGLYHIYDFLASFTAGITLGLQPKQIISSLKSYSPAFGRVEKLPFGHIFLIKNPAGATQVFETLAPNIKPTDALLLALNDNLADGTDVSWIWDAGFESLQVTVNSLQVIVSGTRTYDLAVRLKYAGFDPKKIIIEPELENALKQARKGLEGQLFILPTYTAMLKLQSILVKAGIKKHYWEEE